MGRLILAVIRFYQRWISANTPATCRFEPSCSNYTLDAVQIHGAAAGGAMGALRILRCHPLHPGGYDPVPPRS